MHLKTLYEKKLPISVQKKNDLLKLCTKGIIPEEFHAYFSTLPVDKKTKDRVPVPAIDDDSDYSDNDWNICQKNVTCKIDLISTVFMFFKSKG